jgi:uncharacterized Zn-binding protein involved in type VI secretion
MVTRRYDILNGDRTSAGRTVEAADGNDMIGDRAQVCENDPIWCPACQSIGRVVTVGKRLPTSEPDGRETALSDDLCVCKCSPSPHLIPSQYSSYTDVRKVDLYSLYYAQ